MTQVGRLAPRCDFTAAAHRTPHSAYKLQEAAVKTTGVVRAHVAPLSRGCRSCLRSGERSSSTSTGERSCTSIGERSSTGERSNTSTGGHSSIGAE